MNTFKSFNSVADFSATLSGNVINYWASKGHGISYRNEKQLQRFAGVSSIQEAQKLLAFGDAKSAEKIKAVGEIVQPAMERKPLLHTAVVGCLPHIPNYLRGVPNSMLQIKSNARKKPIINIFVECTIYDGIDEIKLAKECAFLADTITAIELTGYRVALYAVCGCENSTNKAGICVTIKEADAPLNLLNISFPLTNKAFCRAIFLRWIDTNVKTALNTAFSNYGRPIDTKSMKEFFNMDGLFFSMIELVEHNTTQNEIETKVNEYILNN